MDPQPPPTAALTTHTSAAAAPQESVRAGDLSASALTAIMESSEDRRRTAAVFSGVSIAGMHVMMLSAVAEWVPGFALGLGLGSLMIARIVIEERALLQACRETGLSRAEALVAVRALRAAGRRPSPVLLAASTAPGEGVARGAGLEAAAMLKAEARR